MDKVVVVDEQLMNALWNDFYKEEDKWDKLYAGTKNNDNWYLIWRPWMQAGFESAIGTIAWRLEGENKLGLRSETMSGANPDPLTY